MIQWLNKNLNETQKPLGPRGTASTTNRYAPVSPYKQYPDDNQAPGTSFKYANTINLDKYSKYDDYNSNQMGGTTSFGYKTAQNPSHNGSTYLNKSGTKGGYSEYDREPTTNLNKVILILVVLA